MPQLNREPRSCGNPQLLVKLRIARAARPGNGPLGAGTSTPAGLASTVHKLLGARVF